MSGRWDEKLQRLHERVEKLKARMEKKERAEKVKELMERIDHLNRVFSTKGPGVIVSMELPMARQSDR